MNFGNILSGVKRMFQPKPLISPLPEDGEVSPTPTPSIGNERWRLDEHGNAVPRFTERRIEPEPSVMPADKPRNPNWDHWQKINPKGFQELLSGARQASARYGVPMGMLMDVSGLETSGGTQLNPPAGHTARGYFMFNNPTIADVAPAGFDPMSATESAMLAAKLMKLGQLRRWAVLNAPGAGGNKLTDFYSDEELSPFLR